MSDSPVFSILALPPELEANELLGLHDQFGARVDAVLISKGRKRREGEPALPEGVEPMEALPALIALPWKRFGSAVKDLRAFREDRAAAKANAAHAALDETEQSLANTDCDDRWRAFEQWNGGVVGLSDDGAEPAPAEGRWLYAQVFPAPDGLRFITRRPRVQWAEMVPRMRTLAGERAQAVLEGFGGQRHYRQLVAAHERFGKAFGFTTAVLDEGGGTSDGRPQWLSARDALRSLVQKVEAYADPQVPGSAALVSFLLAPYVEMVTDFEKSRRGARKKADPAVPATTPAVPATPATPTGSDTAPPRR